MVYVSVHERLYAVTGGAELEYGRVTAVIVALSSRSTGQVPLSADESAR